MKDVMLDLETLGTKPGSVIVSIGAVKFNEAEIVDEFYQRIDIENSASHGFTLSPSTILWWMQQSNEARIELCQPGIPLMEALNKFSAWVGDENPNMWGNGVGFDNALLSHAYSILNMKQPWKYSGDRCYRTVKNLYPHIEMDRGGVHHNALDDARSQGLHLIKILKSK